MGAWAISCGVCDQCLANRRHTCRKLLFLGCPGQLEGCLREQLVMPEENCFRLAAKTTLDQGALVEPLSIAVYAASLGAPRPGETVDWRVVSKHFQWAIGANGSENLPLPRSENVKKCSTS